MRLLAALRHELVFQYRAGLVAIYGLVTLLLAILLMYLPTDLRQTLTPLLIFSELAPMGTFFVCGMVLLEKGQGVVDSLIVTPLRLWEYLAARSLVLTALGTGGSVLIAASVSGLDFRIAWLLPGVVLTSLLFTLLGLMISARVSDISQFLVIAIPRIVPAVLLLYFLPVLDYMGVRMPSLVMLFPGAASLRLIGGAFMPSPDPRGAVGAVLLLGAWVAFSAAGAHIGFRRYVLEKGHAAGMTPPPHSPRRSPRDRSTHRTVGTPSPIVRVASLLRADLRSTMRDPLLFLPAVAPVMVAIAVRLCVPWLRELLVLHWGLDISPYYDFITASQVLLVSLLTGAVVGFMILDERDERTLLQLAVSPLGRGGYLAYRMTLPVLVGFAVGSVTLAFSSLVNVPVGRLAAVMAVASLGAPPVALLLASFAPSKVEGIALNKAVGAVIVLPAAAYLIPRQWEISMVPVSPYWVMRAIQTAAGPPSVFYKYVLLTAVANLFWVIVLSRAFSRRID